MKKNFKTNGKTQNEAGITNMAEAGGPRSDNNHNLL